MEDLSEEAGAALLAKLGVKGELDELKEASREFGGHALALTLVGTYLEAARDGDVRCCKEIPPLPEDQRPGKHARRVMLSYEIWLADTPELDVLRMMGPFDRPAPSGAVFALRKDPPIPGLTDRLSGLTRPKWKSALTNLRKLHLLAAEDKADPGELDCHPLIREHFGEKLKSENPEGWKEAHSRLFDYYCSVPEKHLPDTIDEMQPLFAAVRHGCEAGRRQEARENVYRDRIQRGNEYYCSKKLGAVGALSALAAFFDEPWSRLAPGLSDRAQSYVLNAAAFDLRSSGRLAEAVEPFAGALECDRRSADWTNSAIDGNNLSELHLVLGDVDKAVVYAGQSVEWADRGGNAILRMAIRTAHADALHHVGGIDAASALFREAEDMQKEREYPLLYSVAGFRYCVLLLELGQWKDVIDRAKSALELDKRLADLLSIALDHLSLGRAHLQEALVTVGDFTEAKQHLDQAVDGLRQAGTRHYVPRALHARAELYRLAEDHDRARKDMDEAWRIAERGGMRLHMCDCRLEYARLHLAQGEPDQAREQLEQARKLVNDTGYHRRDKALAEIEGQLTA